MKNRRIGPDTIMNIISGISILSWVIVGVAFIIIAMNNPSGIRASGQSGSSWMTTTIYALFVFLIILSISGILFNITRLKRKTDKMRITPIISGILAIFGLIIMSIK
ncbi:MAG: hypothetical protein FWH53_04580 [Leptospirales bacterium]|nr:hypothetical protein [Leptospirales bacterium]